MGELRLVLGGYSAESHAHTCVVPTMVLYDIIEPMHAFCIIFPAPQLYLRVRYPLQFFVCHAHPITQQYESRTVRKVYL